MKVGGRSSLVSSVSSPAVYAVRARARERR